MQQGSFERCAHIAAYGRRCERYHLLTPRSSIYAEVFTPRWHAVWYIAAIERNRSPSAPAAPPAPALPSSPPCPSKWPFLRLMLTIAALYKIPPLIAGDKTTLTCRPCAIRHSLGRYWNALIAECRDAAFSTYI